MPGHGDKLNRKQEQAIAALLTETTIEGATRTVGIGHANLKNWLKLLPFLVACLVNS